MATRVRIRSLPTTRANGRADFALFTSDGRGGMEYVYQTSQVGQGVTLDFATKTDIPLTAPDVGDR